MNSGQGAQSAGGSAEATANIRFDTPPVRLAMLTLLFQPIRELRTLDLAALRTKWQGTLPQIHEMYPLPSWVEDDEEEVTLVNENGPWPMPACLFLNFEGDREVLVQNDRLILTWRFSDKRDEYPGFPALLGHVREAYDDFAEAIEGVGFEPPKVAKVSLRYSNIIDGVDHQDAAIAVLTNGQIEPSDSARPVDSVRIGKHYCATDKNRHVTLFVSISEGATTPQDDHGQSKVTSMGLEGDSDIEAGTDPFDRLTEVHESTIEQFVSLIGPGLRKLWGERYEDQ